MGLKTWDTVFKNKVEPTIFSVFCVARKLSLNYK